MTSYATAQVSFSTECYKCGAKMRRVVLLCRSCEEAEAELRRAQLAMLAAQMAGASTDPEKLGRSEDSLPFWVATGEKP